MLKTIDLFAGAGGLSYGFEATGEFLILAAAENNKNAQKTYIENHQGQGDIIMIPDVRGYNFEALAKEFGGIDVVIGGPPCQGFSNANRQKNHIISMNNSLVKEYFRAIKEIKPKAFVMENVSMLSSDTHRFYDSTRDHELVTNLGITMRDESLVIADEEYNGFVLFDIINKKTIADYRITDELFQLLNVLYKNRNNQDRLESYLKKYASKIICSIDVLSYQLINNISFLNRIRQALIDEKVQGYFDELGAFLKFQKSFRLIEELDDNEIIYSLKQEENSGKLVACVKSYSVIDYANNILGDEYIKNSGVVNSLWFGVPQERKRFIMIGIKADELEDTTIEMPKETNTTPVTVGEAIFDLSTYDVNEDIIDPELIEYHDNEDNISKYAKLMRNGSSGVKNHIVPKSRSKAKERFAALQEGENFHNLQKNLKDNYAVPERTQNSIYLRLDSRKPSGTVINVRKSMWIHPQIDRAISVREAARLQSFPDRFVFKGTKDAQYQQVGNAVPPLMAQGIAKHILKYLKNNK